MDKLGLYLWGNKNTLRIWKCSNFRNFNWHFVQDLFDPALFSLIKLHEDPLHYFYFPWWLFQSTPPIQKQKGLEKDLNILQYPQSNHFQYKVDDRNKTSQMAETEITIITFEKRISMLKLWSQMMLKLWSQMMSHLKIFMKGLKILKL